MNEALSTKDVAQLLGVEPSTIGTWKSRMMGELTAGIHFVKDDRGALLWLPAGIEKLKAHSKAETPPSSKTETPPSSKTETPPSSKTETPPSSKTETPPSSSSDRLLRVAAKRKAQQIEQNGGREKFLLYVAAELMEMSRDWDFDSDSEALEILAIWDAQVPALPPSQFAALEGSYG